MMSCRLDLRVISNSFVTDGLHDAIICQTDQGGVGGNHPDR